jgi:hypothetical protein
MRTEPRVAVSEASVRDILFGFIGGVPKSTNNDIIKLPKHGIRLLKGILDKSIE